MDDDALIAAVARGDDGALRELFTRHASWLTLRLRRVLPGDAVEDVLQETFIAAWRGAGRYAAQGAVGAWLWGIARRQAAQWARTHGHADQAAELDDTMARADPAATAIDNADVQSALAALGPVGDERRVLARLVFVEDRPLADVAAQLGIPVGTVKSRVYALRRLLRTALRQGGE